VALTLVERPPAGPTERILLLLPGYGDGPDTLVTLVDRLDPEQRWHVAVARPPLRTPDGPAWFTVTEAGPDPAELAASVASIDRTIARLLEQCELAAGRAVLGGYSQGGAAALAAALDPTVVARPGAVAALAAYLPHRDTDQDPALAAGVPVLVAHGEEDEVVDPILGRSAARVLERAGAAVTWRRVPGDHRPGAALVDVLRDWLADRAV